MSFRGAACGELDLINRARGAIAKVREGLGGRAGLVHHAMRQNKWHRGVQKLRCVFRKH